MAHKTEHRQISTWLPVDEADDLERIARDSDRSVAAELRRLVRARIAREKTRQSRVNSR